MVVSTLREGSGGIQERALHDPEGYDQVLNSSVHRSSGFFLEGRADQGFVRRGIGRRTKGGEGD